MIDTRPRTSTWMDKLALVAITVLAAQMHSTGAPERADATSPYLTATGVVLGLAITVILVARLFGKKLPGIPSDQVAFVWITGLVIAKIVVARVFLGV